MGEKGGKKRVNISFSENTDVTIKRDLEEPNEYKTLLEETLEAAKKLVNDVEDETNTVWTKEDDIEENKVPLHPIGEGGRGIKEDNEIDFQIFIKPGHKERPREGQRTCDTSQIDTTGQVDQSIFQANHTQKASHQPSRPVGEQGNMGRPHKPNKTGKSFSKSRKTMPGSGAKKHKTKHKQGNDSAFSNAHTARASSSPTTSATSGFGHFPVKTELIEDTKFSTTENAVDTVNEMLHNTDNMAEGAVKKPSKFPCTKCSASYSRKEGLLRHLRKVHNEDVKV